jgi:antitoxin HicB
MVSTMARYIALIRKDTDSGYGVSSPDVPGVITGGDTIDEALQNAPEVLAFAAEDWREQTGKPFPKPRSIDDLRKDPAFQRDASDAVVAAIPFRMKAEAAE